MKFTAFIALLLTFSLNAFSENIVVEQKNKQFSIVELNTQVGDTIEFLNSDPFFHNVFSISDSILFDLGSYPQGKSKSITLVEKGIVEVECAIHPSMILKINVTDKD